MHFIPPPLLLAAIPVTASDHKEPEQKPLPQAVVAQWENAGAEYFNQRGVQGFYIKEWPKRGSAELPAPEQPFGIWVASKKVTDAEVKEVVRFTTLLEL